MRMNELALKISTIHMVIEIYTIILIKFYQM